MKALALLLFLCAGVAAQNPLSTKPLTDFPELSAVRAVTTVFEDGRWHRRPKPGDPDKGDNTGDGTVGVVIEGDTRRWVIMMRTGTPPPGGAFWTKLYEPGAGPYEGWAGNQQQPPIKGLPGVPPYSHGNTDTWHWFQQPYTLEMNWFTGVKPGYLKEWAKLTGSENWQRAAGVVFSIQRATSTVFAAEPENYTRYSNELWLTPHPDAPWENPVHYRGTNSYWGGVAEGSVLVDTYNFERPRGVGFYTGKTRENLDDFGERHRSRIGRYFFELEGPNAMQPLRSPPPGPESYVFDSRRDGAGGEYGGTDETALWGTANTILQQSVFINPYDGYYHLLCWSKTPNTRQGKSNETIGLAHFWSPLQGAPGSWVPDSNNPLFTRQTLGWPLITANQLNSPHGYIDPWEGKGYIFFWGNPEGRTNKTGTCLWCIEFDLV